MVRHSLGKMEGRHTFSANAHLVLCVVLEETLDTTTRELNMSSASADVSTQQCRYSSEQASGHRDA